MKYILMMNTMKMGSEGFPGWPKKDIQAHIAYMKHLNSELRDTGELVGAEALTFPEQARLVRASNDGMPITDGVFPESKEFLAGFWIVDVDTPERAYAVAARASSAPGNGGGPMNMPIEVRAMMTNCPDEFVA